MRLILRRALPAPPKVVKSRVPHPAAHGVLDMPAQYTYIREHEYFMWAGITFRKFDGRHVDCTDESGIARKLDLTPITLVHTDAATYELVQGRIIDAIMARRGSV